ncbi:uncharacterized protein EV420DRAFT_737266 [Desarmillaria tabescens]|uniref:Uncharacterized protein n=1 Tax=Armillaria tabescens TaxID=1929756 RepID=A0AA39JZ92_ARMTA|nr:uncharacterized protein EV420DRAFT_737266 [Desarmillaria tabescens]KAK0450491.1 hypothetical protein EV420DRAFT_737266 [Desarmillaria tabescens]
MSALHACLQVVRLAEAASSSVPYVRSVAKVALLVFQLLDQRGKNKENVKELCDSIANTIVVIDTLVRMQGERGASCFKDICGEMEGYLHCMVQDIKDMKHRHRGLKSVLSIDEFRDTIQAYNKRVNDLKMDFLIHVTGDCLFEVMQMHCLLKDVTAQAAARHSADEAFVIWIPKTSAVITALFFFKPRI